MDEVIGKLKVVVFHNNENLYSVIKIKTDEDDKYLTVVGNFSIPNNTNNYKYYGEYYNHPRFGTQFVATRHEELLPSSKEETLRYLSSPLFKSIGLKTATKIVDALGEDALEQIKTNPNILDSIVSAKQKESIVSQLTEADYFDEAIKLFMMDGLSMKMLLKIRSVYQDEMISKVKANPYKLVEDIDGFGFKLADALANKLGFEELDPNRIMAALLHSANQATFESSSTYTSLEAIIYNFKKIIPNVDDTSIDYYIAMLMKDGKLYKEDDRYYPYKQYEAEIINSKVVSRFVKRIINEIPRSDLEKSISEIEKDINITYDDDQKESIINCINSGISIITGGPGTGKTTIIDAIIQVYDLLYPKNKIILAAPTGRASKRLSLITGHKAATIHSHLKWDLHSNTFSINKDNPLQGDLLIIDEFSMVDNILLSKLLDASMNISQIIIVGDSDQLPSVGPGNVLHDLIDSDLINVIKLNKIYRQDEVSNIIKLAHHIKNNEDISEDFENDVTFYETNNINIKNTILEYIKLANKKGYTQDDIQVVAPMYSGVNGIDNINMMLQEYFNPRDEFKLEIKHGSVIYREGDKILQLKNQNEDDVYNGDIGTLISIEDDKDNKGKKLVVDFDGNLVEYSKGDLINIRHAYCISVHKSQGSEYPLIIAPFSYNYQRMLAKNLVYTAITRARKKLVLVGDYNSFLYGVNNEKYQKRYTGLKERLIKSVNNL